MADHRRESASVACRVDGPRETSASRRGEAPGAATGRRPTEGLVGDRLLEAGLTVVPVHPNQLAAARDRYRTGGGKSDGFDAYVLAELARTDMHRLRPLQPDSAEPR